MLFLLLVIVIAMGNFSSCSVFFLALINLEYLQGDLLSCVLIAEPSGNSSVLSIGHSIRPHVMLFPWHNSSLTGWNISILWARQLSPFKIIFLAMLWHAYSVFDGFAFSSSLWCWMMRGMHTACILSEYAQTKAHRLLLHFLPACFANVL